MKISIIIPVYGVEKYIKKNIESLLAQKYEDLEFVFVDDCSKDHSMNILNESIHLFKNNAIKIVKHDYNQGVGAARLTGLMNATGDYVWFIDSDDWIDSNATILLSKIIEEYRPDIVQFSHIEETNDGNIRRMNDGVTLEKLLWLRTYPCLWRNVFKKQFLVENEIYPVAGINYAEDFEMISRIYALTKKIVLLPTAYLYNYNNTNVNSYTHNINLKSLHYCIDSCNSIYDFYKSKNLLDFVKPCFIYVYLRWFIEISNKDNEYLGMNIAYNNIMKMYPQLRWYVDFAIKNKKTGLILFALKLYRIVKFNLLYNFSSHYKPTVVRALV